MDQLYGARSGTGTSGADRLHGQEFAIEARGISKRYRRHQVLSDVSFAVPAGGSLAIVGANGCGKSTLLKICAGITSPDSGQVTVRGQVGYCPQELSLSPFLSPWDHFTWFGRGAGLSRSEARRSGSRLARAMAWDVAGSPQVRNLSGGTQQKLNVAATMVSEPTVVLFDEPYQGFDQGSYVNFWDLVAFWQGTGIAIVVVTHMLQELNRVDAVLDLGKLSDRETA